MKRFERWILPALAVVSVAVTFYASRVTSLAFDELGALTAVARGAELVKRVAREGVSQLFSAEAGPQLSGPVPGAFVLLAGWTKLSLGRVMDPLTSVRLPWLLLSLFAPLSVYGIVLPSRGRVVAAVAALTLLFLPRWLHGSVVSTDGTLVASVWLVILVTYVKSQERSKKRWRWALAAALASGFGMALSLATTWVLLLILMHFQIAQFRLSRRTWKKGRLPLPHFFAFALLFGPVAFFVASPVLWKANSHAIVRHVLAPLGMSVAPTEYLARVITKPPVPGGYAIRWLLETTPLVVLVLALAGVVCIAHRALARRFASGALRPARDRTALGAMVVLGIAGTLIGPMLAPDPLTTFPPRVELALPFVAIAAALGMEQIGTWVKPPRLAWVPAGAIVALLFLGTISGLRTAGASFSPLFGGASGAVARRSFRVGDGSEIGPLLPAIVRRGGARSSDVPPALFTELASLRRIPQLGASDDTLVRLPRGSIPNAPVVRRDGVVLWALVGD